MLTPAFIADFLSNAAATILGAVIGIPLALAINRHAQLGAEGARKQGERQEIDLALHVLSDAIGDNSPRLQRVLEIIDKNEALFDIGLDTSTWQAVRVAITSELHDTELRRRVAYHFNRLAAVTVLYERYLQCFIGPSMTNTDYLRNRLGATIHAAVRALVAETNELQSAIQRARSSIGGPYQVPARLTA